MLSFYFFVLFFVLPNIYGSLKSKSPIKHLIVVMQENRSFDHFLGHLKKTNPKVDGVTGKESNPYNPHDKNSKRVHVHFNAGPVDPNLGHDIGGGTRQIFGDDNMTNLKVAPMNGFVADAEREGKGYGPIAMGCHTQQSLPVLSTLANEFLVFDRWFSSVPGPTEPNRAYVHAASSHGLADNDVLKLILGIDAPCFETTLADKGLTWGVYFEEFPTAIFMKKLRDHPENFHTIFSFETACRTGELPTFSFVEPRYFDITKWFPANDQHPDHDVTEGEKFYKWIYEMVRASPAWNETAILFLYDEHGGFYDHVPTPLNITNPDGIISKSPPFNFDRLGVRVPAVLASPWIEKGSVENKPKGPFPDSEYEHSSISATFRKLFGIDGHLNKRDKWAGTFEHVFTRKTPRTDCPTKLPNPPKPKNPRPFVTGRKMNSLQQSMVATAAAIAGHDSTEVMATLLNEQDGGSYCQSVMKDFIQRGKNKKKSNSFYDPKEHVVL